MAGIYDQIWWAHNGCQYRTYGDEHTYTHWHIHSWWFGENDLQMFGSDPCVWVCVFEYVLFVNDWITKKGQKDCHRLMMNYQHCLLISAVELNICWLCVGPTSVSYHFVELRKVPGQFSKHHIQHESCESWDKYEVLTEPGLSSQENSSELAVMVFPGTAP